VKFSIVLVVALVVAAGVIIGVRVRSSSSNPCPASAQSLGVPGSPPPYTPPPGQANQPHVPIMTIASTPSYKGTPPPGFASWDDYAQYIFSRIRALPMGTAVTNFGEPPLGFKSWEDLIVWAETQGAGAKQGGTEIILQPVSSGVKPPSYATFQVQVPAQSSGGITELAKGQSSSGC
jgi:hypothetical protein